MYRPYWSLEARPFENHLDPRFFYSNAANQATLLKLRYAVESRCSAALLAGAAGSGKTLLTQTLGGQLDEQYHPLVHLKFPQMPPEQLLAYLADELTGQRDEDHSIQASLRRIERMLQENVEEGRHAVVVIDEAHLLREAGSLEMVRLLLNYSPQWTVILVGQPPILTALERMPELDERLGVKCLMQRFHPEDSVRYIQHRLSAAGARQEIFHEDALERVHYLAEGSPRRINRLCDLSLLIGYAEEFPRIDSAHVEAIAQDLVATSAA